MLKIPLEQYRSTARFNPEAIVELDDEGGRIRLSIELEHAEITGRIAPYEEPTFEHPGRAVDEAQDPRIAVLEEQNAELRHYRVVIEARRNYLEEQLARAAQERTVDRELLPDEARALAAALWHYAGEAEAFGRRP